VRRYLFPFLLIAIGAAWLLAELGWFDLWSLFWPLVFSLSGLAVWLESGIHKSSFPVGGGLLLAGALSAWRTADQVRYGVLLPIWLIGFGVLLALSQTDLIPVKSRPLPEKEGS